MQRYLQCRCTECTVLAVRTGIWPSRAHFARLLHAESVTAVHYEQNRATNVQDEQDFPVWRDISLRNEQATLSTGVEVEIC